MNRDQKTPVVDDGIIRRRRVPRRSYGRKVGLLAVGNYEVARAEEIGERGMLIVTPTELRESSQVVLTFHVPGLVHAVVRGIIRYVLSPDEDNTNFKYGIEFINIDFNDKRQIRYYVASSGRKVA